MPIFFYLKAHLAALAAVVGMAVSLLGWVLQARQTQIARNQLKIAAGQLEEARIANKTAILQLELARSQAAASEANAAHAEERAALAHAAMKSTVNPSISVIRWQGGWRGQEFRLTNDGKGPAYGISWDYVRRESMPNGGIWDDRNPELTRSFMTNNLSANAHIVFMPDYDRWQRDDMLVKYHSADGRGFITRIQLQHDGSFRFEHYEL